LKNNFTLFFVFFAGELPNFDEYDTNLQNTLAAAAKKLRSALALLQFHESVVEQYLHFRVFTFCVVRMK